MLRIPPSIYLLFLLTLSSSVLSAPTDQTGVNAKEIPWFDGSVQQAFAQAAAQKKPVFLYWGAVWCPPCEEIKQTVFSSPQFIAQSQLFIPVYIDGDSERAQGLGEQFAVQGYPTMIVFNPRGEEITRIPGAIEIERYNTVLGLSLNAVNNVPELIVAAQQKPSSLRAEDYTLLAYYSWDQENLPDSIQVTPELLTQLSEQALAVDNELAGVRLLFLSLQRYILDEKPLPEHIAKPLRKNMLGILRSPELVKANLDFSMFLSKEITELVAPPGEDRDAIVLNWRNAMEALRYTDSISKAEQLGTWYPQLHLYWLTHPDATTLPKDVADEVKAHIATLDKNTRGSARQTVINKAYQVFEAARMIDESRAILLAEIEKSADPYYFMSGLAMLEESQQNFPTAVDWLAKAYASAKGPATRFQWGVEYIQGLVRMTPDDPKIMTEVNKVLGELTAAEDYFTGRNLKRLKMLLTALDEWPQAGHQQNAIDAMTQGLQQHCNKLPANSQPGQSCRATLATS